MSNDVKVDFDPDPNDTHMKLLESFFAYINAQENFIKYPSHVTRKECRKHLSEIHKLAKDRRLEIMEMHGEIKLKRNQVYEENRKKRIAKQEQNKR